MKPRLSILRRLLRKILPRRVPEPPIQPPREKTPRARSGIEPLEGRIAPATLTSANAVSFTDLDGDAVTVTFSNALFDPAKSIVENRLNEIFKFSDGTAAVNFESTGPQQLQLIDLTKVQPVIIDGSPTNPASGTSIVVRAVKGPSGVGDDLTNVGAIEAAGLPLGAVRIEGDLGQIDAGTPPSKVAVAVLAVETLGKFGASTQVTGTTASDALESRITGKVRTVTVNGDVFGYLHAVDGTGIVGGQATTTAPAKFGAVTVAGSLRGNAAVAATSNNTGTIESAGAIRAISVLGTGDATGLVGGGGLRSGSIVGEKLGTVNISSALIGGAGAESGAIISSGDLAVVTIGAGLKGGAGAGSGSVTVTGALPLATVSGGILGGAGESSGVLSSGGAMGAVVVNGDITGVGANSGGVSAAGDIASVVLNGKLTGGAATHSGFIEGLKNVGFVKVTGDVTGGLGTNSGTIVSGGDFGSIVVKGRLVGDQGANSGSIFAGTDPFVAGTLAFVKVKGGIQGGDAINSGSIVSEGAIGAAVVGSVAAGANLQGGAGNFSGAIWASGALESVTIKGAVLGGGGDSSGTIQATGLLGTVNISGALTGGAGELSGAIVARDLLQDNGSRIAGDLGNLIIGGDITGGTGESSGRIQADGNLAALTARALTGGEGVNSGSVATGLGVVHRGDALTLTFSGAITSSGISVDPSVVVGGRLAAITVGGGLNEAEIHVGDDLGIAVITGNVTDSLITARGPALPRVGGLLDVAIGTIRVSGNVTESQILAGYDLRGLPDNADASIGRVKVAGNWTASDLVSGVADTANNGFGNADDAPIAAVDGGGRISQIAAVVIKGAVAGSAATGDHFGFVAQQILAFKHGSTTLPLDPLVGGQTFELGTTGDVTVREVAVT